MDELTKKEKEDPQTKQILVHLGVHGKAEKVHLEIHGYNSKQIFLIRVLTVSLKKLISEVQIIIIINQIMRRSIKTSLLSITLKQSCQSKKFALPLNQSIKSNYLMILADTFAIISSK